MDFQQVYLKRRVPAVAAGSDTRDGGSSALRGNAEVYKHSVSDEISSFPLSRKTVGPRRAGSFRVVDVRRRRGTAGFLWLWLTRPRKLGDCWGPTVEAVPPIPRAPWPVAYFFSLSELERAMDRQENQRKQRGGGVGGHARQRVDGRTHLGAALDKPKETCQPPVRLRPARCFRFAMAALWLPAASATIYWTPPTPLGKALAIFVIVIVTFLVGVVVGAATPPPKGD